MNLYQQLSDKHQVGLLTVMPAKAGIQRFLFSQDYALATAVVFRYES